MCAYFLQRYRLTGNGLYMIGTGIVPEYHHVMAVRVVSVAGLQLREWWLVVDLVAVGDTSRCISR